MVSNWGLARLGRLFRGTKVNTTKVWSVPVCVIACLLLFFFSTCKTPFICLCEWCDKMWKLNLKMTFFEEIRNNTGVIEAFAKWSRYTLIKFTLMLHVVCHRACVMGFYCCSHWEWHDQNIINIIQSQKRSIDFSPMHNFLFQNFT